MEKLKHKKNASLRSKIFIYFILATAAFIILIWLLQSLFFEYNYVGNKRLLMRDYGETIYADGNIDGAIDSGYVASIRAAGIDVYVVYLSDGEVTVIDPEDILPTTAPANSEVVTRKDDDYDTFVSIINAANASAYENEPYVLSSTADKKYLYYARIMNDNAYLILLSDLTVLTASQKMLKSQMLLSAFIVFIVAFLASFIISKKLSEPIDKMSKVAESWAGGDESAVFDGGGYKETDELASALNYAKSEINKSEKLRRDLLANISHDLKTPLTMIRAYAEMIRDISGDVKEKRTEHTNVIISESDRLTSLVNDILKLSKMQSSVDLPVKKVFNLTEVVETVLYRFEAALEGKGYKINSELAPDVYTEADESKIESVVYNLVGNSINYTGEDKTVNVYLTVNGNIATLEIIDTGSGIGKDKIDGIWDRYLRYSETHTRTVKGTGLGLSIVKAVLEAHGLEFGVISRKDEGSNFFVKFIIAEKPQGDDDE